MDNIDTRIINEYLQKMYGDYDEKDYVDIDENYKNKVITKYLSGLYREQE